MTKGEAKKPAEKGTAADVSAAKVTRLDGNSVNPRSSRESKKGGRGGGDQEEGGDATAQQHATADDAPEEVRARVLTASCC